MYDWCYYWIHLTLRSKGLISTWLTLQWGGENMWMKGFFFRHLTKVAEQWWRVQNSTAKLTLIADPTDSKIFRWLQTLYSGPPVDWYPTEATRELANWNRRECLFIILLFVILTGADLHLVLMASFRQIQIVTSICRADCCQHEPGVLCKRGAGSTLFCKSRPLHLNLIGTLLSVWCILVYIYCCRYCTINFAHW